MTLTELKYVIAVARERHFGRAAESCFVSQPSLSVAIKKLEDELGVQIFERRTSDIALTPIGSAIVEQAQRVIDESRKIYDVAMLGQDPLTGPMRIGVIYTVAPYLLPGLVREMNQVCTKMPIYLQENYTAELINQLRNGQIDVGIMADTIHDTGFFCQALYQEDFVVAVPTHHPWVNRNYVSTHELSDQTMLLLGSGHCFRDQILEVCPELTRLNSMATGTGPSEGHRMVEGSSLQTICHMVSQGLGITVLPSSAVPFLASNEHCPLKIIPFKAPVPHRKVMMVWRKSFTRLEAVKALIAAVKKVPLNGCFFLDSQIEPL